MSRVRKFLAHSTADRLLLLEALGWLCWIKLLLHVAPFRWIAPRLGPQMGETPSSISENERDLAHRVSWAVEAVARNAPIRFVCLPQAIAAKWMLRRRHLASTLYLGLRRNEPMTLTAHAWLRAGDKILTGRGESSGHQVIATFGGDSGTHRDPPF